ncbi:MAG: MOSC N-terminal beta barrel domain-containing protein [Cyanobacteria bacterium J06555_13]
MATLVLSGLHIYPIKSAAGLSLHKAELTPRGFHHDRRCMVVDVAGQFMTQRRFPKMALIQVTLPSVDNKTSTDQSSQHPMSLCAPGMPTLVVSMEDAVAAQQVNKQPTPQKTIEVEVWGDRTQAIHLGPQAQQWLTDFLSTPCQLVYMPATSHRPTDHGKFGPSNIVSFADAFPYLLISEASLAELNTKLKAKNVNPVPMNRFRPNLVVNGCESPHAEDQWQRIRIGEAIFSVAKPCARCSVPTVDQSNGEKASGNEPIKTLSTYRAWDKAVWFGQNLIQENPEVEAVVRVGDRIEVLD